MRIEFFIVGVQKGGTTALDALLRRHPGVQMSKRKEVHYFDNEELDWSQPDPTLLHDQFDWTHPALLRGEATPIYLYWPRSIERLRAYNPDARLIVALRHPVFRAYSHWRMEITRNAETLSFSDAIRIGRNRVAASPNGAHKVFSYVERGYYDEQLTRLFSHFPRDQVYVFRTDNLWRCPTPTLAAIEEFLGLETRPRSATMQSYVVPLTSRPAPPIEPTDKALLESLFLPQLAAINALTGIDVADWADPGYIEPMGPR